MALLVGLGYSNAKMCPYNCALHSPFKQEIKSTALSNYCIDKTESTQTSTAACCNSSVSIEVHQHPSYSYKTSTGPEH